jgi:holo-[acyl-carrier protein] synthase
MPDAANVRPATGIDLIEIPRIAATIERFGERFLNRVFTEREQTYCRGKPERLAGRFAAKEAVSKALGIGIRRLRWRDIEILPRPGGQPAITLYGLAQQVAIEKAIESLEVSITHSRDLAAAVVVGHQVLA